MRSLIKEINSDQLILVDQPMKIYNVHVETKKKIELNLFIDLNDPPKQS